MASKYHYYEDRINGTGIGDFRIYDTQTTCQINLKEFACNVAISQFGNCMPDSVFNTGFPGSTTEKQNYCNGKTFQISASNIETLKTQTAYINLFSNLLGSNWDTNWDTSKTQLYGTWTCNTGRLVPPASVPAPTRCDFPDYSMFSGGLGRNTCTGSAVCESQNVIRAGSGTNSDKNFFCINDAIIMCPNSISTYTAAKASNSGCTNFNPLAPTIPTGSGACSFQNPDTNGRYFKYGPPYTLISEADITSYLNCVRRTGNQTLCFASNFGVSPNRIYRCNCVAQPGLLCTIGGVAGLPCDPVCTLSQSGFNVQTAPKVTAASPLAFIKVLSDFLFWLAVIIFVINFLRAGLSYAQSKGDESKLKEASAILTSTIGGMVFILLMGGLVRYILDTLGAAGLR